MLANEARQVTPTAVLQNQVDELLAFLFAPGNKRWSVNTAMYVSATTRRATYLNIQHAHDVVMLHPTHDADLAFKVLQALAIKPPQGDGFDGNHIVCFAMVPLVHGRKRASTEVSGDDVIADGDRPTHQTVPQTALGSERLHINVPTRPRIEAHHALPQATAKRAGEKQGWRAQRREIAVELEHGARFARMNEDASMNHH